MSKAQVADRFCRLFIARAVSGLMLLAPVGLMDTSALAQSPKAQPVQAPSSDSVRADLCRQGYVWRRATADDHVCVTPKTRDAVADDNATADERRRPGGGDACLEGYVWRFAYSTDHVCVTQQIRDETLRDNRLAASQLATFARRAPITPSAKLRAPYPPHTPGCHQLMSGGWRDVPCVSDEYMKTHPFVPPGPENSIQSNAKVMYTTRGPLTFRNPIIWGSVTVSFLSDPTQASETDSGYGKNPVTTPNAFSVQTNTNYFTCPVCATGSPFPALQQPGGGIVANSASNAGDQAWVQFAYQSGTNGLCVWIWDLNVYYGTLNYLTNNNSAGGLPPAYGWKAKCVNPAQVFALTGSGAALGAEAEVIGYISCPTPGSNSGCTLEVVGILPWTGNSPDGYPNVFHTSMLDSVGLAGLWTNVSGTLLGNGGGSNGAFTKTKIRNVLRAYACLSAPPSTSGFIPPACPPPVQYLQKGFELSATDPFANVTGETNNLTNGPTTFVCEAYDCFLAFDSSAP
jgi:hypothetical protein